MADANMNWFGVLAHHAIRRPDQPLAIFEGETTTYAQMAARATALAAGLQHRGVRRSDVVGLLSYNCPEMLETLFAANRLGAIAMPINWRLAAPEVRYILEHSEARALVSDHELVDVADAAIDPMARAPVRLVIGTTARDGRLAFDDVRDRERVAPRVPVAG